MRRALAALTAFFLLAMATVASAQPGTAASIAEGRQLAQRNCAMCHAIGEAGDSPNAMAPAFRELNRRHYPFDWLVADLKAGMLRNHPAMPDMRFSTAEIESLVAYLRSIQQPPGAPDPMHRRPNQPITPR